MKIIKRPDRKRMKNEISFKLNERTKAEEKNKEYASSALSTNLKDIKLIFIKNIKNLKKDK